MAYFPSGSTFVEVGCYLGRSLCCLAGLVKESGKRIRIVGVDWCRGSGFEPEIGMDNMGTAIKEGGGTLAGQLHKNILDCGFGDMIDLIIAGSEQAARYIAGASVEMVFLDAAHDFESVRRDLQLWAPKVRLDGWIGGDDLSPVWPGVEEAVTEKFGPQGERWHPWGHDSWRVRL